MENKSTTPSPRIFSALFFLSGAALVFSAIPYNEFILEWLDSSPPLAARTVASIRRIQLGFLLSGVAILLLHHLVSESAWLPRLSRSTAATRVLLAFVLVIQPFVMLDLMLSTFAYSKTLLFVADDDLGWRLRPLAEDYWGDVIVKINAKGLRGPVLDYEKDPDVKRILYLGDSVTFGYRVEGYENSFPYQIESYLESATGHEIETINSGVGGYSPWQQFIFLEKEGIRYDPDLIIVSFVLNDVTEKFELTRFGGWSDGFQLEWTATGNIEWLLNKSALYYFGRKVYGRLQFGSDVQGGAAAEELTTVRQLAEEPDKEHVRAAWQTTLGNLRKIVHYTQERRIPLLIVVFPFTFQFEDPEEYSAPQHVVAEFAKQEGVSAFDLLPPLKADIDANESSTDKYFSDSDHLTALGCRQTGQILAREIKERGFLDAADVASEPSR